MIHLHILYPKKEGAHFDWEYYLNIHMPLSKKLQGEFIKGISIVKGIEDIDAAPVSFVAITNIQYNSVDDFMNAFMPHIEVLQGDMKNYTNIEPQIQFSEEKTFI